MSAVPHRPGRRLLEGLRAVAFDLDGTLIDTAPDIASATNRMLTGLGAPALPRDQIRLMIGEGVDMLIRRALIASRRAVPGEADLAVARALFREAYGQTLFRESRVYPGVADGLARVTNAGLRLGCVTNKDATFTLPLLEAAGLRQYFDQVLCPASAVERKPAPTLLLQLCSRLDLTPEVLLMVGDSHLDVAAGRAAGCRVVAVSYGYHHGTPAETLGADAVVASLTALADLPAAETRPC